MRQVSPYWSQKGLLSTYYKTRRSADEKILVWQMYWRGENFYTENEIYEGPSEERTVFLGDRDPTVRPLVADATQRGAEHFEVEVLGRVRRGERLLDHAPCLDFVALYQPIAQAARVLRPRGGAAGLGATRRGRGLQRPETRTRHAPLTPDLARVEPAGAHVPIRGHVVHPEQIRSLLQ